MGIVEYLQLRLKPYIEDESFRFRVRDTLARVGFDTTDWVRVVMYQKCFAFIQSIRPETLEVPEISGGPQWRQAFKFGSYTSTEFPRFQVAILLSQHRSWPCPQRAD